jgi:hypothetical protein
VLTPNSVDFSMFQWCYDHMMLVAWPTIIIVVWRASKWITEITAVATKAVTQVDKMATEHFPTMCTSLQKQDELLHSMDTSLKTIAQRSQPVTMIATAQPVDRRRRRKV